MKIFTNNGTTAYDIVHMIGNKDTYTISESAGTITYENSVRKYIVNNVEEFGFKHNDVQGNSKFKWTDEIDQFKSIIEPTTVSFSSYASATPAFAPYSEYGLWRVSNLSGTCGITIAGDSAATNGMGVSYGGRTISTSLELWGTGPQIYYYVGSGAVSFTIERLQ